ncbi:hypothetical protein F0562_034628 [Nyssa sinensis]|uniref:RRM domain-containing protein n=1 Tax=Nyssa sinensis TaxID=561372 RepID=A0A5J5A862_9ASTE|nr:hypothetical protein F0562_034628 [Nyssa sinensis]
MPQPSKSNKQADYSGQVSDETGALSNNLWVGNLARDVNDSDLRNLFRKHGVINSITSHASRGYAFIYFNRIADAKAAMDGLQGSVVRGSQIRIQFARPAKPCKSLCVSGISPSVSKEKLEEEFLRFGKIEEFKLLRHRNTAFIDFLKLEDAFQAFKSMNGKQIGGDQICVDFLRSQPSRREKRPDLRDAREGQFLGRSMGPPDSPWIQQSVIRNYSDPTHSGSKGQQLSIQVVIMWVSWLHYILCLLQLPGILVDYHVIYRPENCGRSLCS